MIYPTPTEINRYLLYRDYIIGVDPGDMTGVVVFSHGAQFHSTHSYESFLSYLRDRPLGNQGPGRFVVEQFVTRPGVFAKTQIAGKVCGALDLYCLQNDLPIIYQQPSTIKTMLPDKKALKAAGWSWSTPHECDALRHAIYYLLTRK